MSLNIRTYQSACETVLESLENNSQVLAVIVCGSIITGDIWKESDIDLIVITKEMEKSETIYSRINKVPVQINYISKDIFINTYNNMLKGGTFHKSFFSGKLMYCIDDELKEIHRLSRIYGDKDRNMRNIEILCNLLNSVHYGKKYMVTGKSETAFQWCMEALQNYSRLIMNVNGHITDKDVISYAVSMDNDVAKLFSLLFSSSDIRKNAEASIKYIDSFIDTNIEMLAYPLIQFLKESGKEYAQRELEKTPDFDQIDTDINLLLVKLSKLGIISESTRKYTTYGEELLIEELVYHANA